MDWITGLNKTMDYIEAHLSGEIDYEQLARLACCSSYHYQRMFAYMAGVSLGEYIRRRRMSVAAADLQGGEKVLEVALKSVPHRVQPGVSVGPRPAAVRTAGDRRVCESLPSPAFYYYNQRSRTNGVQN